MKPCFTLVALLASLGVAASVRAEPQPEPVSDAPRQPSQRRRPGTHFIGELRLGSTLAGTGTMTYGGALGAGGRWHGLPPMYLVGAVDHAGALRSGAGEDGFVREESLSMTALSTGLRLYVPVVGPFRVMGEITVGAVGVHAFSRDEFGHQEQDAWLAFTELGVGPQFRLLHQLSLGARAAVAFVDTSAVPAPGPVAAWAQGLERRTSLYGTMTLHF